MRDRKHPRGPPRDQNLRPLTSEEFMRGLDLKLIDWREMRKHFLRRLEGMA